VIHAAAILDLLVESDTLAMVRIWFLSRSAGKQRLHQTGRRPKDEPPDRQEAQAQAAICIANIGMMLWR